MSAQLARENRQGQNLEETPLLSVIISTTDAAAAVQAIENSGGYVTSDLWLIDSLAAVVPADQLIGCLPGDRA